MSLKSITLLYTVFLFCKVLNNSNASRVIEVNGVPTVLAVENEKVTIDCEDDTPMSYCGVSHPNGTRFSFAGPNLTSGKCSIKLQVRRSETGEWMCHIGKTDVGVEIVKRKIVRVADKLAAVEPNITSIHGKQVTLYCTTAEKLMPLTYCRFVPPNDKPFSISQAITKNNSILGRFFFPENKSLDRGDCAVTIKKVKFEDVGTWSCGAWLEEDKKEFVDVINLKVNGLYTMSTASATGITFGVFAIIVILGVTVFFAWKRKHTMAQLERAEEAVEMQPPISGSTPHLSRSVPSVVVQSPSEPGGSPITVQ